ncbi:unnamed protein product, partial [Linum tenue]
MYESEASKPSLVEETENLATNILPSCLFVVHNASRSCQHNESELPKPDQARHMNSIPKRNKEKPSHRAWDLLSHTQTSKRIMHI